MDLLLAGNVLNEFHFLRPLWLLLMLPVVLLVFYLWRINESSSAWDKAIDKSLLPYLLDKRKNSSQRTPLLLLLLVWIASIFALAGPVWERLPQPVQKSQDALVIILDLSLSMYATDYDPNRLTIARRKLLDVLTVRSEGQTGLVVYAGDAHTVTPLTDDSVTISALAPSLSPNIMPSFGSNPILAVERAITLLIEAGSPAGRLLLITDGIESSDARGIRQLLEQSPYSLSVLGIGTRDGAPIPASNGDFLRDSSGSIVIPGFNKALLEDLAGSLDGRYSDVVLSSSDLDYLLADYSFRNGEMLGESGATFDIWQDAGPWLLLLILPLSALIFRRGWVLTLVLTGSALSGMVIPTAPAQAAGWQDLWKTKNQQAAEALASEDAETAAALFEAPDWKGTAAYKAGDYEGAIQSFSQQTDVTSLYNLGNAYAQARKFEEAIQAYEAALAIENNHADALHNKEIVEQLLEEQEQQEEEERQNQEQQEQQEQEKQDSAQSEPDQNDSNPQEQEPQEPDGEENEQEPQSDDSEQQQQQQEQQETEDASTAETEDQESLEQWLRRINDDPGELLQRKFQFEYRRRQLENRNAGNPPVERQIW